MWRSVGFVGGRGGGPGRVAVEAGFGGVERFEAEGKGRGVLGEGPVVGGGGFEERVDEIGVLVSGDGVRGFPGGVPVDIVREFHFAVFPSATA